MATFIYGCLCFANFGKGLALVHGKALLRVSLRINVDAAENPENRSSLWALAANTKHQEKVRADVETEQPSQADRLVIE
jgi:hypothetical protein